MVGDGEAGGGDFVAGAGWWSVGDVSVEQSVCGEFFEAGGEQSVADAVKVGQDVGEAGVSAVVHGGEDFEGPGFAEDAEAACGGALLVYPGRGGELRRLRA